MVLVISAKSGQLGNRLFIFANAIAFAIEHQLLVLNPAFEEYAEFFQSTAEDILCAYPAPSVKVKSRFLRSRYYALSRRLASSPWVNTVAIPRQQPFNWSTSELAQQAARQPVTFLEGWLYREGWFMDDLETLHQHGDRIRAYFAPLPRYQRNISALIERARQSCDLLVGLHIRQGDYAQYKHGKFFFTTERYVQLMQSIVALFPNQRVGFLICSNAAQEQSQFASFNSTSGSNHIIEDLYALAACDYLVGPPSTYTMWAAFYGQKPLYMVRQIDQELTRERFVYSTQWQGIFYPHEDWSQTAWEWTH